MAEQPIKSTDIIDNGLFNDAIKQADLFLVKSKELEEQLKSNLIASKEYINTFKGEGAASIKELNKETVKVNATLQEYEKTKLGIAEIEKKQAQLKAELAKANREELKLAKDLAKEEAKRLKQFTGQNSEYKKASDNLRELKKQLKDLSIAGKEDTEEFKKLNKEFSELDKRVRAADESVGDFQRNVGNYPKQLNEMQKALMDLEPGTEEFIRLSKEAGKLKDKINDAKDATKSFATGSKATQAKNIFGQIGTDIADLNFQGAAKKAKTFATIVRSISFAEVVTGIKAFGMALYDVGKALLLNPFTAIAAAAAGLAYVIYDLTTSFSKFGETTETVNESLKESQDRINELSKRQLDYLLRIKIATGQLSKEQGEIARLDIKNSQERKDAAKKYSETVIELAKKLKVDITKLQKNRFKENYELDINELNRRKKFNIEIAKLEKQYLIDSILLTRAQVTEKTALIAEQNKIEKNKDEDKLKDLIDLSDRIRKLNIEDNKDEKQRSIEMALFEEKIAIREVNKLNATRKQKSELIIALQKDTFNKLTEIENKYNKERDEAIKTDFQKTIDARKTILEDNAAFEIFNLEQQLKTKESKNSTASKEDIKQLKTLIIERKTLLIQAKADEEKIGKNTTEQLAIQNKADIEIKKLGYTDEANADEEEFKRRLDFSKKLIDIIAKEQAEKNRLKQDAFNKEIQDTENNIDTQRKLAERGQANTLAFEEKRKRELELEKEEEKQKEIKRQKALAFFKLFASYAEKDPNTALTNALRDTILAEAVSGAFFTGTEKVEDDLKINKVHDGRDGYRIAVDGSERIMTGEQNKMVGGLSNEELAKLAYDYNNGLLDTAKYAVIPNKNFASNIKDSALLMQVVNMNKEIQNLQQIIKQRPTTSFEFDGYGDFIKKTIENGFTKVTRYQQSKPRI